MTPKWHFLVSSTAPSYFDVKQKLRIIMKNIHQETKQPFGIRNDYPPRTRTKVNM